MFKIALCVNMNVNVVLYTGANSKGVFVASAMLRL